MFKKWKQRKEEERKLRELAIHDAYVMRLHNSYIGFCGTRHEGKGPFLSISEIQHLIWKELESKKSTLPG